MTIAALLLLAAAPSTDTGIAGLLAGTAGDWCGRLEYRDYKTDTWEGLPMATRIAVQPDGLTLVRTSAFDDGPKVGIVWIIGLEQFDPATGKLHYASLRRGKPVANGEQVLSSPAAPVDPLHWQVVARETVTDGPAPADARETLSRDGDRLTTLKEVAPAGSPMPTWKPRNRTALTKAPVGATWPQACFAK